MHLNDPVRTDRELRVGALHGDLGRDFQPRAPSPRRLAALPHTIVLAVCSLGLASSSACRSACTRRPIRARGSTASRASARSRSSRSLLRGRPCAPARLLGLAPRPARSRRRIVRAPARLRRPPHPAGRGARRGLGRIPRTPGSREHAGGAGQRLHPRRRTRSASASGRSSSASRSRTRLIPVDRRSSAWGSAASWAGRSSSS